MRCLTCLQAFEAQQSDSKGAMHSRGIKMSERAESSSIRDEKKAHSNDRLLAQNSESSVVHTLHTQISELSASLRAAEDEIKRLTTAVASREQELSRSTKLMNMVSGSSTDQPTSGSVPSNRLDQLLAADTANKRVIDQLNGHVDFLNEQLAHKEEQLLQGSEKLRRFDALQAEMTQRASMLEQARRENNQLITRMRSLEQKVRPAVFDVSIVVLTLLSHRTLRCSSPVKKPLRMLLLAPVRRRRWTLALPSRSRPRPVRTRTNRPTVSHSEMLFGGESDSLL